MVRVNWVIWIMAMIFMAIETTFFGNNFFPKTPEEVICDGIVLLLLALSVLEVK